MGKQPTESLRAGLSATADLPGIVILDEPAWDSATQRWVIHCRIAASMPPDSPIPAITGWYVFLDDHYPDGDISIYPAKADGITQTFPHQNYNGLGKEQQAWRTGKLCTWTNIAPLRRKGYDIEPGEPERNLAWHLERVQEWLELASRNELAQPGDPFELPDLPNCNAGKVAFCEGPSTLAQWRETADLRGIAAVRMLTPDSSIATVIQFNARRNQPPIEPEWRKAIGDGEERPAIWIRTNSVPVLPPWQLPATWGELRQACQKQDVNLDALLRPAIGGGPIDNMPLLIGFPIPDKIGGSNLRMHWLALLLPGNPDEPQPGFRNNEKGRWQAYRHTGICDPAPLNWLPTENWHYDEVSVRGRLNSVAARSDLLVIGAGALGSVLAEMLARAGIGEITIIDPDHIEAGNLVRHTLLASDIGQPKALTLAARLNAATLHASIAGINAAFPPTDVESAVRINACDVVIDTTGDDKAATAMGNFLWGRVKTFVSVSLGIHACRLFCFTARGPAFPNAEFRNRLQPWLLLESSEYDVDDLPRDGPGCWHPRHPARIDDVWMMAAAAVRLIEQVIINPPDAPVLTVFERQTDAAGNFVGIKDVSRDEKSR